MPVTAWIVIWIDRDCTGATSFRRPSLRSTMQSLSTSASHQLFNGGDVPVELCLDQLHTINAGAWGIVAPAAAAFGAGYAVGSLIYKHCKWARWV